MKRKETKETPRTISLIISEELFKKLKIYADKQDRSVSWVTRKFLKEFLEKNENK